MSDQEEEVLPESCEQLESFDPDLAGGACGGWEPVKSLSPGSNSVDNLSMEVQFEEESSRHPSEISSLSYQNLLDEGEGSGHVLSRQQSEDSNDSFPPDYGDSFPQETVVSRCNDLPSEISAIYKDQFISSLSSQKVKPVARNEERNKVPSQTNSDIEFSLVEIKLRDDNEEMTGREFFPIDGHETMDNVCDENKDVTEDTFHNAYNKSDSIQKHRVQKRNSLEIRNNIPTLGEIKDYHKDLENLTYSSQGAKPKIRKQSPGLACRIGDGSGGSGSDREGSSSERETERPVKITSTRPSNVINPLSNKNQSQQSNRTRGINTLIVDTTPSAMKSIMDELGNTNGSALSNLNANLDVQNEYDYVKYARVQDGDSYVGMRLAYSSTDDANKRNSLEVNGFGSTNTGMLDISREASPEKSLHPKQEFSAHSFPQTINEDTLTEIPLNTAESVMGDDKQAFSLSPETTECDSIEVESVTSDGDKSNLGMPLVEDGLSSSQASDNEDIAPPPSSQVLKSPTALLRKKQKADLDQELLAMTDENGKSGKKLNAEAIMEDLKAKREALDIAISDIKSAIQNSKGVAMKSPYKDETDDAEPVWVMRVENEEKKDIQQSRGQEINESSRDEQENVFQMENEKDSLLENQYSRNDGKPYQPPRGYDTDDEEDSDIKYTRRILGKKYASLPKDDSFDHHRTPDNLPLNGSSSQNNTGQYMNAHRNSEYIYKKGIHRHVSDSLCSDSDEYGSDTEGSTKTAYLKQKLAGDFDTDEETDVLLQKQYQKDQYVDIPELTQPPVNRSAQAEKRRSRAKEGEKESLSINDPDQPEVLIEGVLFRARYLGSTQLISEGQPSKAMRMMQAQEAVGRIKTLGALHFGNKFQNCKHVDLPEEGDVDENSFQRQAPDGENQPSTAVDLFVSTEKIMVLNTDLQEIMMDHSLRTISYIADIGDILVIMARRRVLSSPGEDSLRRKKQAKILCHVFESDEAQLIAQSIGQAFQVAYMEFLKANGIEDPGLMKEIDYQDVLNQQEIYGEELNLFSNKELHKEVIVPKMKSELLGIVIVESGWGSMVPTVVLANMSPTGPAARCGQLNIGDQIISINGISLVGLPLSSCQNYIKGAKNQTVVKLTVVPCPPVVEVLIKRPDVKYQLGFSVQNGVICSLLRGGIAERGGVRVGHRIIEINNQSVVAVPHEKIVALLANSVGEIHMKTMPTSIFRLLTGQETPHYL